MKLKTWCAMVAGGMLLVSFWSAAYAAPPVTARAIGMPGMQSQRIDESVFGGHAYVYEAGKEHARSIMLLHGLGGNGARDFSDHISWLARSYHVVVVDLPGFGQSAKANVSYSPTNYAKFLKQVADRFIRHPFALIGHSMGAVVALRYAANYPNDVTRLVVIDAPGILHRNVFATHSLAYLGTDYLPPMAKSNDQIGNLISNILSRVEASKFDPEMILTIPPLREKALAGDPNRIAALAVAIEDLSKDIRKVQIETLVIWGKKDAVAPLRTGVLLEHVLPRSRLVVIERAGHVPMEETPDRFRAVLEPFLENGLAGSATPVARDLTPVTKHRNAVCEGKRNIVYEGDYDTLSLNGCHNIGIQDARVRKLRVVQSSVTIENSHIGGGGVALDARSATVVMTNGRIEGDVAIAAIESRFDLAGVDIEVQEAVMKTPSLLESSVVFSISRVRGPGLSGDVHGFYRVAGGQTTLR